jgi:hypothetical protein
MTALQQEFAQSVTLGECWRTPEQALWNATHGTGVAHSLHTERLAIDLNLFKDGVYLTTPEAYAQLGAWWVTLGPMYRWGGNFKSRDNDHYSISPDGTRG